MQAKKDTRDVEQLAAAADLKSQTKLEAQLEKKLQENPDSDVAAEGLKSVRAALEKTKTTIAEDPQKQWDAEKSAKVEEAKKTLKSLQTAADVKNVEKEIVTAVVDERAGLSKKPTQEELRAVAEEATNQEKLSKIIKAQNDEEEQAAQKEEVRLARAEAKNPRPSDAAADAARNFDEEQAAQKKADEARQEKLEREEADRKAQEDREAKEFLKNHVPCDITHGECWTANMPAKYLKMQMASNNMAGARSSSSSSDSDSDSD